MTQQDYRPIAELTPDEQATFTIKAFAMFAQAVGPGAPTPLPEVWAWLQTRFLDRAVEPASIDEVLTVRRTLKKAFDEFLAKAPEPRIPPLECQYQVFRLCMAALFGVGHHVTKKGTSASMMAKQAEAAHNAFIQALASRATVAAAFQVESLLASFSADAAPAAPKLILPTDGEVLAVRQGRPTPGGLIRG